MYDELLHDFKLHLQEEELSTNTIYLYIKTMERYIDKYSDNFSKTAMLRFKDDLMNSGRSPKTVNIYLCGLKSYCKYKGIPFEIKKVKIQKESYVKNVMSIDQYNKLITSLKKDGKTQRVLRYKIIAETGARISEALQFKVRDFQQGYMRLYTKGKVRTIHIPARLQREVLQTVEKEDHEEYIIKNRYGHKMTARGYSEGLIRDCEKCQIPKEVAHPHSLRHMFAVEFLKRNGNISLLADLLGHSGVNTTMIYTRLSFEEQIKQLNDAVYW